MRCICFSFHFLNCNWVNLYFFSEPTEIEGNNFTSQKVVPDTEIHTSDFAD
jgi:hypothetical protein